MFFYYLILVVALFICGGLCFYSFNYENIRGSKVFSLIMLGATIWLIFYLLELITQNYSLKLFWFKAKFIGIELIPPSLLLFSLLFTGRIKNINLIIIILLTIKPFISLLLIFTNDMHSLFFTEISFKTEAIVKNGIWFWIHISISYIFIILGIIFILLSKNKLGNFYKRQSIIITIGILIPFLMNILNEFIKILSSKYSITFLNPTLPSFIVASIILFYGVYKFNFFDINPIARDIVFDKINDGILVIDKNGRIVDGNPAVSFILDRDINEIIGTNIEEHLYLWPQLIDKVKHSLNIREEIKLLINEEIRYFDITFYPIYSGNKYFGKVMVGRDITDRKNIEEKLRFLSFHDSLTGLYNRIYFEEEIKRLQNSRSYPITVFIFDLDNLKIVNDTMGHQKGDELLKKMARFLKHIFRADDMIARIGGDEFIVILPRTSEEIAEIIHKRLVNELKEFNKKDSNDLKLSFSIGIKTKETKGELSNTIREADELMYKNKRKNKL